MSFDVVGPKASSFIPVGEKQAPGRQSKRRATANGPMRSSTTG
jgi:hypothetical protein